MSRLLVAALVALLHAAAPLDARAQIGRVAGTVTDEEGRPIKGATITAENREQAPSTFTSTSDQRGRFALLGLRRATWAIAIQAPGFEPALTRMDVVTTRPNPPLTIRLVRGSAPLPPGPLAGVDVKDVQRRIDRGAALAAAGDLAGAVAAYRELLERVPALTALHFEIGSLHERLNDPAEAASAYKRLLEIEPGHARAKAALERVNAR
ncbi:MAG TPA: carboxypeptidase regulatory-like domain-containing protein [Vicinamibacterales bacterium]|nr:carboxypeptidase regulatory-like domain-containing protein [Vicinamibacterales bacterium]